MKKKRRITALQALEAYREWLRLRKLKKPIKGLLAAFIAIQCHGQTIHVSSGMSLNVPAVIVQAEAGHRGGPVYAGVRGEFRSNGWPYASVQPIVGIVGSWNNNRLHELTTMAYVFYSHPISAKPEHKSAKREPVGFGFRHYLYRSYFDGSYSNGMICITFGWSFGKYIYR